MGAQETGPTLEGLAQRLEALERENTELRNEVVALRSTGTREDGPAQTSSLVPRRGEERVPGFDGRMSRRRLLSRVGAAAAGLVVAGALTQGDIREARANHFGPGITADFLWAHYEGARKIAVTGEAPEGTGVKGIGSIYGVHGQNTSGVGVRGTSSASNLGAVEGHNNGGGAGVAGVGQVGLLAFSHTDGWPAAWGRHTGNGFGVAGDSARGPGVSGFSTSGYGGQFDGGKAQLRIVPKPAGNVGPPSGAHAKGEIYMDSAGALFVCTAGGTTPTWKQITTTAV